MIIPWGCSLPKFFEKGVDFAREFEAKKPPLHLKGSSLRGTLQFANRERMPIGSSFFRACRRVFGTQYCFFAFLVLFNGDFPFLRVSYRFYIKSQSKRIRKEKFTGLANLFE